MTSVCSIFRFSLVTICLLLAGYGVFAERSFAKSNFLLVYRGDLVDASEAYRREEHYVGCFMYYFTHCGLTMW